MRRRLANCFVAIESGSERVVYTLSAAAIATSDMPESVTKRLPRYGGVPAALIGRLAVDRRYRGMRLGEALLFDAAERALRSEPAVFALLVDAKDATAASFYRRYGFMWLSERQRSLFVPMASFRGSRREEQP